MSVLNVNNLLLELENKIKASTTVEELLMYSKSIEQLKLGALYTVPSAIQLPNVTENGLLYFVEDEETVYFYSDYIWKPLFKNSYSSIWAWSDRATFDGISCNLVGYSSPVTVKTSITDWINVSSYGNGNNNLAIRENGELWSWGANTLGQSGIGNVIYQLSPVKTPFFSDWKKVSAGRCHSLGIRANGTLWGWGNNGSGRLGNNSTINRSSPVSVVGAFGTGWTDWVDVSAGYSHTTGIRSNNSGWSWGNNSNGQLGDGTTTSRLSPVSIVGGISWENISSGNTHTLGISKQGIGFSWGRNLFGEGGTICSSTSNLSPVSLFEGIVSCNWRKITGVSESSVGLKTDGSVWIWGESGLCNTSFRYPTEVPTDKDWLDMSGSWGHILLLKCDRTLWAWGWNYAGHLGDGTTIDRSSPVQVLGGFNDWCAINAATYNSAGLRANGTLWTWGRNTVSFANGNLGTGDGINRSSPVTVIGGFTDWCKIASGRYMTHAIRSNGTLWGWGGGDIIGDGETVNKSSPVSVVGGFTDWCFVTNASYHTLAGRSNGTLWAWGPNWGGQLGDGTTIFRSSPVSVIGGFTDWCQAVGDGNGFSIGLRSNSTIWTWGSSDSYDLGDGTFDDRSSPVQILSNITDWCAVDSSFRAGIAIRSTGEAWAWGFNLGNGGFGKLTGYKSDKALPEPIVDEPFINLQAIAAGNNSSAAIDCRGVLATWGFNRSGTIGNGNYSTTASLVYRLPQKVVGGFTDWCQVSVQRCSMKAVRTNGTAWSWGHNVYGGLADGTTINRSSPVSIAGGFTDWSCVIGFIGVRQRDF